MGRHVRALLVGIVVGVLVIVLLEKIVFAQTSKAAPRAALVNDEVIALAEVDAVLKQRGTPLTAPTAGQVRQMRLEAVTTMIDDLLVRQFMRAYGPKIDPAEIAKQFAALEANLKAQGKTPTAYLTESNQTEAQVKANMLMLLQLDRYVKEHTSEADLKKYYETNKDYFDKITVRSSHIVIRYSAATPVAEREKAKQKLQALRADIVAGKLDFGKAAKENSECPSAPKEGDIGHIFRKFQNVDEAYAKAAFSMKVNEISEVVETDFGYHLIKVTERTEGKPSKYEPCAEDVRDSYSEELRVALLNQLRKKAKVEVTLP